MAITNVQQMQTRLPARRRGFVLLIAVIFMTVMLSFGLALGSLSYKQQVLASSSVDSQYAFYAADAGLECALYADQQLNFFAYPKTDPTAQSGYVPFPATCDNNSAISTSPLWTVSRWVVTSRFSLDSGTRCADVTVYKPSGTGTNYIFSQGYNVPCSVVASPQTGARIVSRGINIQYSGSAASSGGGTPTTHVILLTNTLQSSWSVPPDWVQVGSSIEVIGGGGGGAAVAGQQHAGGGGGAYAKVTDVALSGTVGFHIGAGGAHNTTGADTYFCDSTSNCSSINGSAVRAGAKGGGGGSDIVGGAGGSAGASVGSVKYAGGTGGGGWGWGGQGGGGAGGSSGPGANGGASNGGDGGGGGGGANNGAAGSNATGGTSGGTGGLSGAAGGLGGTFSSPSGQSGSAGSGGGGGYGNGGDTPGRGGAGGDGTGYIDDGNTTAGPGGGGGGAGHDWNDTLKSPGDGGFYGGGGGGVASSLDTVGGRGAQGIIIITYTTGG